MWLKLECAQSPEDLQACLRDIRHTQLLLGLHEEEILVRMQDALDTENLRILEDRFVAIGVQVRALQRLEVDVIDKLPNPAAGGGTRSLSARRRSDRVER